MKNEEHDNTHCDILKIPIIKVNLAFLAFVSLNLSE